MIDFDVEFIHDLRCEHIAFLDSQMNIQARMDMGAHVGRLLANHMMLLREVAEIRELLNRPDVLLPKEAYDRLVAIADAWGRACAGPK